MTDEQTTTDETKRGRVRRLFVEPMQDMGFKRPPKMDEETFQKKLTRMTDYLTYMSDSGLRLLFDYMKVKGQGRDRSQWPSRASVYAYAELIEPCPIEKIPSMLSWFRSSAGLRAAEEDKLVETLEFIKKYKKPPTMDSMQKMIDRAAEDRRRMMAMSRDRIDRGVASDDDRKYVAWYEARLGDVRRLMDGAEAAA